MPRLIMKLKHTGKSIKGSDILETVAKKKHFRNYSE